MHKLQQELEVTLGYTFSNPDLLTEALTHKSFVAECDSKVRDNQRLEFLGDAVVQIITSTILFNRFPDFEEGELTKVRATLTREESLVEFARSMDLGAYLRLGRGEEQGDGRNRNSALCDAFEAVMGAIYKDAGDSLKPAATILEALIGEIEPDPEQRIIEDNPKGALQEWTQKHYRLMPEYEMVDSTGPEHEKTFTVKVIINQQCYGTGVASRLKQAEQQAARDALDALMAEKANDSSSDQTD